MEPVKAQIQAVLTLGWDAPSAEISGLEAVQGDPVPSVSVSADEITVANCESLFQRHSKGYAPLKEFVKRAPFLAKKKVTCHFNAFAYSFLKGAKNYDFLFPEVPDSPYRKNEQAFTETLAQLESFEQLGEKFPDRIDKETYLAVRKIFIRPGAREERWVPGELLLSGASTAKELAFILGTYDSLIERAFEQYQDLGILSMNGEYATLSSSHLEIIYFFIRECLGIDPIESLTL